jgi:16S rRNA (cytosine1402-N4)-methyltransferase
VETFHKPILLRPIVESLVEPFRVLPTRSEPHWLVDCTLGGGGHTAAFLEELSKAPALSNHRVLSVDQDPSAIARAGERFAKEIQEGRLTLLHSRFSEIEPHLEGKPVLGLMADLGFSSDQLEDPNRGISFKREGPLDMRLDPTRGISCREYLAQVTEKELADVIFQFGEERHSRRIASALVNARREKRLPQSSQELASLVLSALPASARHGRIHGATRTFQALRIQVNQELDELESLMKHVILQLKTGGRVAILSFHSLEDRIVKQVFKNREGEFRPLTKKPIEADEAEVQDNPRSRSAKLRLAERVR